MVANGKINKTQKTMKKYSYILMMICLAGLVACKQGGNDIVPDEPVVDETDGWVEWSVTASLGSPMKRVSFTPSDDQQTISLAWEAEESLGVYIRATNGSYRSAGRLTSSGEAGTGNRTFTGEVRVKHDGEEYVYMHPYVAGSSINLSQQMGVLGDAEHLHNLVPLLWAEGGTMTNCGYVLCVNLTFNENPGTIHSITLQTMTLDANDNAFAGSFVTSTMRPHGVKSVTFNVTAGSVTGNLDGTFSASAYIVGSQIADKNVFRSKYNVVVTAQNGTYQCEYRSFPGQEAVVAPSTELALPVNGNVYQLSRKMSKGAVPTLINSTYKVNSLLGMWNQFGKSYDPCGLIVTDESLWPTQLKNNKAAILSKYPNNGDGTPTFLGPESGSLYEVGNSGDLKQDNVTFNNITITQPTEVFVTFISEYGWNENLLGYYHYTGDAPGSSTAVTKTLIFPNVSKPNHEPFNKGVGTESNNIGTPAEAPLREFETVKLLYTDENGYTSTTFPAGTVIGLMMMIDTEANEYSPKSGYDLLNWRQWRLFTNTAWNAENTTVNGAATNWPGTYANCNFFASGDVCNGSTPIPGLAIYGVKDRGDNAANTAYGAMIFMVSTSVPSAMQTQNKAYFNIGTGAIVVAK